MTETKTETIALIDLSSIAHATWHKSGSELDPNWTSRTIVERVRALTANHPKAAICCDGGKSFRRDIDDTYKANRPERDAALYHQIGVAKDQLAADGYPVWTVDGFEADDLIASAVTIALGLADVDVLVVSTDKDLLQLVGPRVTALSPASGVRYDEAEVIKKFGVRPNQIHDYLVLVGDPADNIKGAKGIGGVKGADLLKNFGTIDGIYKALDDQGTKFKPATATSLREFQGRVAIVSTLVQLRTDVDLPFAELDKERTVPPMDVLDAEIAEAPVEVKEPATVVQFPAAAEKPVNQPTEAVLNEFKQAVAPEAKPVPQPTQALVPATPDVLAPADADWKKHLEPRSINEASKLATYMHQAKLFNGYGSPQAVLSTIMAGRELGLQSIASLRGIHIVEGKHCLAADLIRGLCLKSGLAKFFRCTERTAEACTFETQRGDDPPMSLRYTIEEAEQAGLVKDKSGWKKNPADMLVARAGSKLARLVYPEVVHGLYAPEEFN